MRAKKSYAPRRLSLARYTRTVYILPMNNAAETTWALVDENGVAVNTDRFPTAADAHMSAQGGRARANGKPLLVGRNVWTAQVDANGRVVS